jgi:hypothetical protein
MFKYDYIEDKTLEELNTAGASGWEIIDLTITDSPTSFNAFLKQGKYGFELIQVETDNTTNTFFIDKSFSYGESILIIFFFMLLAGLVAKVIFGFIWKND